LPGHDTTAATRGVGAWIASLAIHGGIAGLILVIPPRAVRPRDLAPMEFIEQKTEAPRAKPPEPRPEAPKPETPRPTPRPPRRVVRRTPRKAPPRPPGQPPPSQPPETPSHEPPETGPKTFGLTLEGATTAAPGEGVAVPRGDSMAVAPTIRKRGKEQVTHKPGGFKKTYQRGEMAPVAVITTRPRVLRRVVAAYPERMRELGIEGRVVLELTVDANGHVIKIKVLHSLRPELDEAAKVAARKMRFSPATVGGTPVKVKIPYTFTFVLD